MTSTVVVIGVGNQMREDDSIGLLAVRDLRNSGCSWVRFYESRGDGARLLELWKECEAVIIIDAVTSSSPPGTVHRIDLSTFPLPAGFTCTSSHLFGVNEGVETARALGQLPKECLLIGVELGETRTGVPSVLYDEVKDSLLLSLKAELSRWMPTPTGDIG